MITSPVVLVLGAGASAPYGLPVGSGLRDRILNMSHASLSELPVLDHNGRRPEAVHHFTHEFRRSRYYSIDAFLGRRPEYADLGKAAIAATLLPMEDVEKAVGDAGIPEDRKDDWMQYLLHTMDAPWEEFGGNRVSFITFNYDRSLELCLEVALQHRYGKSADEARAMRQCFPIVHVYGSLGSLDPTASDFVPYGVGNDARHYIAKAARGIQVIPEGREDSPELMRARELLEQADRLAFLGFGFDPVNVRRLGGEMIRAGGRPDGQNGWIQKRFAATAIGMSPQERTMAAKSISMENAHTVAIYGMQHMRSLELLRHSLILADM